MPQFEPANFLPQMAWLALVFAILYFGIVRATLPRLGRTMDHREAKVTGDISSAESAKAEADQVQADYEAEMAQARAAAQAEIADRRGDAMKVIEARLSDAHAKTDAMVHGAEQSLAAARATAVKHLEDVAVEAASDIVEKLTGHRPAAAAAKTAVQAVLG